MAEPSADQRIRALVVQKQDDALEFRRAQQAGDQAPLITRYQVMIYNHLYNSSYN